MKALVKQNKECGMSSLAVVDIPKPEPKDDQLLVRVMSAGICGTDIHIMNNEYPCNPPVTLGHEYTGIVEAMGKDVVGFAEGDQVISLTAVVTCGHCRYCHQGLLMLCESRKSIGSGTDGAMAEYVVIPYHLAFRVPDNFRGSQAIAIAEPLACCVRAVIEFSKVRPGDTVLVSGPGTMGQLTLQLVKLLGARAIVAGTPADQERLELALQTGADAVVANPAELLDVVHDLAPDGVDAAFECAGAAPSLAGCIKALRKGGNLCQVGLFGKPITVDMDAILYKELVHTASFAQERSSWQSMLNILAQGQLDLDPYVSASLPLADWQKGFELFQNRVGYKVLLIP